MDKTPIKDANFWRYIRHYALLKKYQCHSTNLLARIGSTLTVKHHCLLCDEANAHRICIDCQRLLIKPHYNCQRCALPLKNFALFCGQCLKQTPIYDSVFSPYLYQAPLKQLLYDYKQKGQQYAGKALGDLFFQGVYQHYQQQHLNLPTLIAPVPLHWRDQWKRRFNQSELFSQLLGKRLGIEHVNPIQRIKKTRPQKQLDRKQRIKSLHNSFTVNADLTGRSIVIVDDVMTTGATVNAVSLALQQAGASQITIWALARTPFN